MLERLWNTLPVVLKRRSVGYVRVIAKIMSSFCIYDQRRYSHLIIVEHSGRYNTESRAFMLLRCLHDGHRSSHSIYAEQPQANSTQRLASMRSLLIILVDNGLTLSAEVESTRRVISGVCRSGPLQRSLKHLPPLA